MHVFEQARNAYFLNRPPRTYVETLLRHEELSATETFYTALHAGRPAESITYGELCRAGRLLGAFCVAHGIEVGAHVLIILPHSADLIRALFGSLYCGVVPSILPVPSFKLNREVYLHEIKALSRRIRPAAIVISREVLRELGHALQEMGCVVTTWPEVEEYVAPRTPLSIGKPEDILLLQHSSGSTGLKKGVELSHRAVLAQVEDYSRSLAITRADRVATWLPLYHDMGLIAATLLPFVLGIPVIGLSPFEWVAKPAMLLRAASDYGATLCWLPNFAYNFMALRVRDDELEGVDLGSMRAFVNCSEPVLAESHRLFAERFAPYGLRPNALHTCYALAECTFAASQSDPAKLPRVERIDRESFVRSQTALPGVAGLPSLEMMSSGSRLQDCHVLIVDDKRRPLPDRHVGEIALNGPYLFTGYFGLQEETEQVLRDGWYYTGDLGYMAEGELFVTGRKKDLIIIGGKNYYPQDIERLISSDENVIDGRVVALGHFNKELGTEELIVLAESQLEDDAARRIVCQELRRKVATHLDCVAADVRLLPHMWLLKTSSGKIARRSNLERYLQLLHPDLA
jgi:fatty-acyl-CoA synthase